MSEFRDRLLERKDSEAYHRKLCRKSYNMDYDGYVFVDEMGNLIKPNYITDGFARLLRDNHLRRIRFHDLRHSCASLLLSNGVPMKQIQEWMGHSDFSTTANIYAHLDYSSKITYAEAMLNGLNLNKPQGLLQEKVDCIADIMTGQKKTSGRYNSQKSNGGV